MALNKSQKPPKIRSETHPAWHTLDIDHTLEQLNTSAESGLSSQEAARRLEEHGYNKLAEAPLTSFWQMVWEQFNNFIVILLLVAALISALLGDWVEAAAIMAIVVLNATLGVIQERRAEEALTALRQLAAPEANVLRDGHRVTVPARGLVPGDIVFLEAGNFIPADVRLVEAVNLRIDEAALTGESVPVRKDAQLQLKEDVPIGDRKNSAFMGTLVTYGRGKAVVTGTGMRTQIGLIAEMLSAIEEDQTPLQRRLDQFGRALGWAALGVCGIVFLVGSLRGTPPLEMFIIAVSLAIAAVPEGLPAIVTISLALGMREMIKRNALIRKLSSVETLGSTTVICSDKTGTLTQNEMTVTRVAVDGEYITITGSGYTPQGDFLRNGNKISLSDYPAIMTALWVGALNNDATLELTGYHAGETTYRMVGDPTEGALVVAAAKAGALPSPLNQAFPRVREIPFDSERKRMVTVHTVRDPRPEDISPFYDQRAREWYVVTEKGAPDVILQQCNYYQNREDRSVPLDDEQRRRIMAANDAMTKDALRVLGVAYKVLEEIDEDENEEVDGDKLERDLTFVGLIGMIDPPRPEVSLALKNAKRAGIRTVMITGDYPNTARAIAEEIDLLQAGHQVLTGSELNMMDDRSLEREIDQIDVFARVSPQHKVRIVQALRARNEIVAMTGDGVNDAPSIKLGDRLAGGGRHHPRLGGGSALGHMVLTDDNYASIVSAVEQGRIIYSNIRKFVYYLLSCNMAEIAIIFLATLAGLPSPLTAIQLLWLNLITDGAPALALGLEEGDQDIMKQPPRAPTEPIINRVMRLGISVQTVSKTAVSLTAYLIGLNTHPENPELAETMTFVTLSFSELLRAFTARSEYYSIFKIGVFSNKSMNIAVVSSLLLLLAVIYLPFLQPIFDTSPLGFTQWEIVLPLLFIPAIADEITKAFVLSRWVNSKEDE